MSRHPSNVVAPFSMLVPVVGILASWIAFGQTIDLIELAAGVAIVGGVLFASRPKTVQFPQAKLEALKLGDDDALE
jgi:O-acetylserine/cysteine efflux transporter